VLILVIARYLNVFTAHMMPGGTRSKFKPLPDMRSFTAVPVLPPSVLRCDFFLVIVFGRLAVSASCLCVFTALPTRYIQDMLPLSTSVSQGISPAEKLRRAYIRMYDTCVSACKIFPSGDLLQHLLFGFGCRSKHAESCVVVAVAPSDTAVAPATRLWRYAPISPTNLLTALTLTREDHALFVS